MTVTLGTEPWLFGYAFFNFHSTVYMYLHRVYTRTRLRQINCKLAHVPKARFAGHVTANRMT